MNRVCVVYSGVVQGVGFRVTVRHVAAELGVVGWVRNNSDGTVTMSASGTSDQLRLLRERIREQTHGRIDRERELPDPDPSHATSFEIVR